VRRHGREGRMAAEAALAAGGIGDWGLGIGAARSPLPRGEGPGVRAHRSAPLAGDGPQAVPRGDACPLPAARRPARSLRNPLARFQGFILPGPRWPAVAAAISVAGPPVPHEPGRGQGHVQQPSVGAARAPRMLIRERTGPMWPKQVWLTERTVAFQHIRGNA